MDRFLRSLSTARLGRRHIKYALYGLSGVCLVDIIIDRVGIVQLSAGPSMYPTISPQGDYLITSHLHKHGKGIQVGDVVRFSHPLFLRSHCAKRVIGMPGDFVCRDQPRSELGHGPEMMQVPEGHVYVVGDNLPWSRDSRNYGMVPMGLISGKIVARIWPPLKIGWMHNTLQPAQLDD